MFDREQLEQEKARINEKRNLCTSNSGTLELFRGIFNYVDYIEHNDTLKQIIANKILLENEIVEDINRKYPLSIGNITISDIIDDETSHEYIHWKYEALLEFYNTFSHVKDLRSEVEMRTVRIIIKKEIPEFDFEDSKEISTNHLWLLEDHHPGAHTKMLSNFHGALLYAINGFQDGTLKQPRSKPWYDSSLGMLHFQGKEIKITLQKAPNLQHHLLELLFEVNPFDPLDFADIISNDIFENKSPASLRGICDEINSKVNISPPFLDFSTGKTMWVRVDTTYR